MSFGTISVTYNQSILIQETIRHKKSGFLTSTPCAHIMPRLKSPAFVYFVNPVCIGIFVGIQSRIIFIESLLCIGLGKSGSTHGFIGEFHVFPSVNKFGQCCGSLESGISVILKYYALFLFSLFSRYKNNTVSGTCSINGR